MYTYLVFKYLSDKEEDARRPPSSITQYSLPHNFSKDKGTQIAVRGPNSTKAFSSLKRVHR